MLDGVYPSVEHGELERMKDGGVLANKDASVHFPRGDVEKMQWQGDHGNASNGVVIWRARSIVCGFG